MSYKLIAPTEPPTFRRFLKRTFALDLLKGLKITLIEMFLPKTIVTLKYPLEKNPLSPRYRAIHKLMRLLESGNERCIGCGLCEKICISNCIKIETSYGADSRKKIDSYTINFGRCIYCGFCAEVCPEIAIIHGERYENATEQRAHFSNKGVMLTPLDLALRGNIDEFAGYGALSENADSNIKQTPTGYIKNSSLGAPCGDFGNLGRFADAPVQSHAPNSPKTPQFPPQILELDSNESNDSSLRGKAEAIQKNPNTNSKIMDLKIQDSLLKETLFDLQQYNQSRVSATESRPIRGAKNRNQGRSSASADFLLESEKRGSPPKSEKRQLLARRGSGAGGAALLREKTSDSISKKIIGDSRIAKMDSSPTAQNDESVVDCHDSAFAESRNDSVESRKDNLC